MATIVVPLQPPPRFRLHPPGVTGLHWPELFAEAGLNQNEPAEETRHAKLLRVARSLLNPPDDFILVWQFLDRIGCVWMDGGKCDGVDAEVLSAALGVPVFQGRGDVFAGEEGGLCMLEEQECHGMVCDLGQTLLKISWTGRRWIFPRDVAAMPHHLGTGKHAVKQKGAQRRVLRRFIADSLRTALTEAGAGDPQGVIFALPSVLDKWGQPLGSSYIGMRMDTQLVTDALELAGLPDIPHWLVNDAELAATSAIFDERVIACGGKALVFTLGTAVGCALADPLAAALHFCDTGPATDNAMQS
jgi:hypothetical protein